MEQQRPYTHALERLRTAGLRPTRQRMALAKLLFDGDGDRHVSAEILHGEALTSRMRVSLATVYNTLHQFTDAGLLREIVVDAGCSYFDTNTASHHHIYVEEQRELVDIAEANVSITSLPKMPDHLEVRRVDVIVRVNNKK
ncbi:MAG: transcriptional repressor [Rhodospirillales bacterium]|nr:transcriptional repressor [Rhodospirillales bacterium]